PRIGELEQVMLYDVDDLRAEVERSLADRRQRLERARAIVEHEAAACCAALQHHRDAGSLLRQLAERTEAPVRRALDALLVARPTWPAPRRAATAHPMGRFPTHPPHPPRSPPRAPPPTSDAAEPPPLLDAARRVFGLADAPRGIEGDPRRTGDR